jgi:hypothetical protein
MSYTLTDQRLKDEGFTARVRIALLKWSVARLSNVTRIVEQDALAKNILLGNDFVARTLTRTMVVVPNFPAAAFVDDAAGDTALQGQVDTLVPILLDRKVLVLADPDAVV